MRSFIVITLFVVALGTYHVTHAESTADSLFNAYNWQHLAGATTTGEGVRIQPLGRVIVHQDGSVGQPNPSVNLAGVHLKVSGDFKIIARMEQIDSVGVVRLYAKPPVVYDQWRLESGSIAIEVGTSTIAVYVWDGSSSNSNDMRTFLYSTKGMVNITLEHLRDIFTIHADGHELGTIPDHHIFDGGEVWFGADGVSSDPWVLANVSAIALGSGTLEVITPPVLTEKHIDSEALRNLALAHPRHLRIGAAVSYDVFVTNEDYRKLVVGQFSMMTPENGMKPQFIHPGRDTYEFVEMDTLVNSAHENGMQVHGHTLVYPKSNPIWMGEVPKRERQKSMLNHIMTVVGHFKGRVAEWDVVNEPLSNVREAYRDVRNGLDSNLWYDAMGEQYIDLAFRAARAADSKAVLYINDYGLERDGDRWKALLGLVNRLKQRGVPIDGVGFESHVYGDGDYSDSTVLIAHMRTLAELGLKVRISEIDVTGDDPKEQVRQYVLALDACLRSYNCTGYSTWGVTDAFGSTSRPDRYPLIYGTSLLFDTKLKAKLGYRALQMRLRKHS